jgi:hypothetical protein
MCTVLLPPGVNPTAVKYISYHIIYHNIYIISYIITYIPLILISHLCVHYLRKLGRCRKFPLQRCWKMFCDKNRLQFGGTILIQCANVAYWLQARAWCVFAHAQVWHATVYYSTEKGFPIQHNPTLLTQTLHAACHPIVLNTVQSTVSYDCILQTELHSFINH